MIFLLVMTAANGYPLAIALAVTTMSGLTPLYLNPQKSLPIRPNPVWTSSEMTRPLYFLVTSANFLKYPSGRGTTPPTPKMGYTQTPAILWLLVDEMVSSASWINVSTVWWEFLQRLGYVMVCVTDSLGMGDVQVPTLVRLYALPTTPWYDLLKAYTCSLPVYKRASKYAKSLASEPELHR